MKYSVVIQPEALDEIDAAYLYIAQHHAEYEAERWFNRLERAILSLERLPRRFALAPEADRFRDEVRQMICGVYRVLFTIRGDTVHVVHVRHTARTSFED